MVLLRGLINKISYNNILRELIRVDKNMSRLNISLR